MHGKYIVGCFLDEKIPGVYSNNWTLFLLTGVFPPVWYKHVSEIAAKSPLLLSMGAEQFLDKELEVNHPLKIENIVPVSPRSVAWVSCICGIHVVFCEQELE